MDILRKTIKKLSDEEYQALLLQVSGKKKNKPYYVLEATRNNNHFDDTEMMKQLQVNPSAYYTLKSRLNTRIAEILSKKVENPIRELMEEVVRVPATLYGTNRDFSIRALKEIENRIGRTVTSRWSEREIDIDLLFYGNEILNNETIHVPHNEIENRKFVLVPMNEIAPELVHPVLKKSISELLSETSDELQVTKFTFTKSGK